MFNFSDRRRDLTRSAWKAGDPWADHYVHAGYENRDQELENFLNNDQHSDFGAVIQQNNVALTATIQYSRFSTLSGMVDVEMFAIIGSAGTANTEITVAVTDLPFILNSTTIGAASGFKPIGHFVYRDASVGWYVGAVGFDDAILYFIVDGSAGLPLGRSPNFAAAVSDEFSFTLRYRLRNSTS